MIDVGGFGRSNDAGVLSNSLFGQALSTGTLQLPADQLLPGADHRGPQPHVFVADEAFPLQRHLMRPFSRESLTTAERQSFNYRLSRARLVVENAFGILSSQWRMYRHVIEVCPEVADLRVKATCVLHNYIQSMTPTQAVNINGGLADPLPDLRGVGANNAGMDALGVREAFTAYFSGEGKVPWQHTV